MVLTAAAAAGPFVLFTAAPAAGTPAPGGLAGLAEILERLGAEPFTGLLRPPESAGDTGRDVKL